MNEPRNLPVSHVTNSTSTVQSAKTGLMQALMAQFSHPQGWLGYPVGWIMAVKNRPRLNWAIALMQVQPQDRILEMGFGPGVAIAAFARQAPEGSIVGLDRSAAMVEQASRRNAAAIARGQVELKQGSANDPLPYPDLAFDKAIASNSHFFWADPAASFAELWRVLKPGGALYIVWQPRWAKTEAQVQESVQTTTQQLVEAGFELAEVTFKPLKPVTGICAIAIRPHSIAEVTPHGQTSI